MNTKNIFLLSLLLTASFLKTNCIAAISYNLTDLGTINGYELSRAWSINDNGQVVGEAVSISNAQNRPILFDTTGAGNNIDLGTLGGQTGAAMSINNSGQIVGTADHSQLGIHATLFDPANSANNLGLHPNAVVWKNNDSGQIAGNVVLNPPQYVAFRAALFDINHIGSSTDLGSLPGCDYSQAISINNNADVVGLAYNISQAGFYDYNSYAVLFDIYNPANNINLGLLPGYDYAAAFSINDNGQIVGRANNGDMPANNYNPRAVLFDATNPNSNIDLGTLSGYDSAEAFSINDNGQIVGRAIINYSGSFEDHAVLFDPTGQGNNINLNSLIDPATGWELSFATSINNNGEIVGWGINPDGNQQAFLLTPVPEPTTLLLLGIGVIFIRKVPR